MNNSHRERAPPSPLPPPKSPSVMLMLFQVRAARNLLSAVTRLLILADMIDVHLLLKKLQRVEDDLEHVSYIIFKTRADKASYLFPLFHPYVQLKSVSSQAELVESMKRFGISAQDLMNQAAKRQYELKDPAMRDDLAAARAVLKKHSMMLLTASKAYVRHPELAAAKANRDFVLKQVCEAVNTISDVAHGKSPKGGQSSFEGPGELAAALDDFDEYILMNPLYYDEAKTRPSLEERLEAIISGAALMADSR